MLIARTTAPKLAADYAALIAAHGSGCKAAAAIGIANTTFSARYARARKAEQASIIIPAAPEPASPAQPDLAVTVASLAETVRLLLARSAVTPASAEAPVPVAAPDVRTYEPETVRATVKAAYAQPVNDDSLLGNGGPFQGEIYGVDTKRLPRIGAPIGHTPRRTLVIGDSHFHPALEQRTVRAMTLVGLHAAVTRPEHVVHIGDGSDWSSCCGHARNETWKARTKPSIQQDLDNFRVNWDALNAPMDAAGVTVSRHYCWGNHDAWLHQFEDRTPEAKGLATGKLSSMLAAAGWSETDYGEYYWIGNVGYTHITLNMMGKPCGGQTAENTIAMQSTRDTVVGHTHRHAVARRPKMDGTTVTVLNAGSSMPEFYVGDYAQNTMARTIDYGVLEVTDFDGRIHSYRFVPMRELEVMHGAKADRLLARTR